MLTVGSCSVFSDEIKDFCVFESSSVVPSTNACACQLLSICFTKKVCTKQRLFTLQIERKLSGVLFASLQFFPLKLSFRFQREKGN